MQLELLRKSSDRVSHQPLLLGTREANTRLARHAEGLVSYVRGDCDLRHYPFDMGVEKVEVAMPMDCQTPNFSARCDRILKSEKVLITQRWRPNSSALDLAHILIRCTPSKSWSSVLSPNETKGEAKPV